MILDKKFFARKHTTVARDLIGAHIVKFDKGNIEKFLITETEAYGGEEDLASHARFGKTKRNLVMFGPAGVFYIYLVYGFHNMLNIVTDKEGNAGAVLIRSIENISGPGRLTKHLGIDNSLNGKLARIDSNFWFEKKNNSKATIKKAPRIGIDYAGPIWSQKPYRFILKK